MAAVWTRTRPGCPEGRRIADAGHANPDTHHDGPTYPATRSFDTLSDVEPRVLGHGYPTRLRLGGLVLDRHFDRAVDQPNRRVRTTLVSTLRWRLPIDGVGRTSILRR